MDHKDHVRLLKPAGLTPGGTWADLGAGSGAFTLALRELVGPTASIYSVDQDRRALDRLEADYEDRFGSIGNLRLVHGDIGQPLALPALDGVVMANSLHFHADTAGMLEHVAGMLAPAGLLLLVEYNTDFGNQWVPYPLSFNAFQALAVDAGYDPPSLLATVPSHFLREIYSAAARKP